MSAERGWGVGREAGVSAERLVCQQRGWGVGREGVVSAERAVYRQIVNVDMMIDTIGRTPPTSCSQGMAEPNLPQAARVWRNPTYLTQPGFGGTQPTSSSQGLAEPNLPQAYSNGPAQAGRPTHQTLCIVCISLVPKPLTSQTCCRQ